MHNIMYGAALTVTVDGRRWWSLKFFEFGDLNQVNGPAFCSSGGLEVIDIVVGHFGLRESIIG